ncbi:MAG: AbrB/MazE/SpoVT family DNA-binding domain-containing protein [Myxococcota bacterium]|nr:AbrB/MazE/SpoVT family DNA-binding domain-containing protein [Myxococcota bacterium]
MSGTVAARTARVGRQGRLVIPAQVRKALDLVEGDALEAVDVGAGLVTFRVRHTAAVLADAQARWKQYGAGRLLVQELIDERRKDARRER